MTDEWNGRGLGEAAERLSIPPKTVNAMAHTNGIESVWASKREQKRRVCVGVHA